VTDVDLDARLRALFADADTSHGFEARLAARVAALRAAPDARLLILAERDREATRQRLRREAWFNVATAAGTGVAALALIWREGPAVARWVEQGLAAAPDFSTLAGFAFVALGLGVWAILQRLSPR